MFIYYNENTKDVFTGFLFNGTLIFISKSFVLHSNIVW